MSERTYIDFLKANFLTFFIRLPLLTLALMPVFFVLYGGEIHKTGEVVKQLMTLGNVVKYFGVLIISYVGHVTYGWIQAKE
jgi:hypothetical protein